MRLFPASRLTSVLAGMAGVADFLRTLFEGPARKYHPELHYMRGPGPKWREKHMLDGTRGA